MTPLERLTAILCECESVKKDVMELRFGCRVLNSYSGDIWEYIGKDKAYHKEYGIWIIKENSISDNEILWNPIQDHHLRMYCEDNKIYFDIDCYWDVNWAVYKEELSIGLDNKKPLYQQSNETLEKIVEFLEN